MKMLKSYLFIAFILVFPFAAYAELLVSVHAQTAFTGYNDVRIPGDDGTKLSLSDDLDSDPAFSPRLEAGWLFSKRHYAGFMGSLLRTESTGRVSKDVLFNKTVFSSGERLKVKYRFDSYRATYRYYFLSGDSLRLGAGLSLKIRDAEIAFESASHEDNYKNTGFVPLINFSLEWNVYESLSVLFYGDFLGAPQGRAEDLFAGCSYQFSDNFSAFAGYRILEGGADNDKVYTFALVHYAVVGLQMRFFTEQAMPL